MTERDVKASHLPLLDTVGGEFWEMSPDMLAVASLDGYFTHVNPAWEVVLGYSVHELTSQPFIDLVHPDDVEETMEDYRQFRNNPGRVTLEFENRYRARDGTYRVLQWSARASQDEQLVYCIARDVTVQRESELALTASERKSRLLTEIPDSLLAHSSSMQELMETAVRVLAEDIGDAAVVSLIDDTGALLVPTAYRHVNPAAQEFLGELYRSTTVRVGQGVAGMVAESGEAVFVGDLPEGAIRELITPQFWRYLDEFGVGSLFVAPLLADGVVFGTLELFRDKAGHSYTDAERGVAEQQAVRIAEAVSEAKSQAELALLSTIATNLAEGVWAVDTTDGVIMWANPQMERMMGYPPGALAGLSVAELNAPLEEADPQEVFESISAQLRRTGTWTGEVANRRSDGTTIWCQASVSTLDHSEFGNVWVAVHTDVTDLRAARIRLEFQASHDVLTGLPNQTAIVATLEQALATREQGRVGVMALNIDRFKLVNDAVSRSAGDQVLVQLADRLRATVRATDQVGCFGGDDFLVIFGQATAAVDLEADAGRVRDAIRESPFDAAGTPLWLTLRAGLALSDGGSVVHLLAQVDAALLAAKSSGGDTSRFYSAELGEPAARKLAIAQQLRAAIDDDEIHAWYQPVVTMADREVVGFEALARWIQPGDQPVIAADFIRAAQEHGMMLAVGHQITAEAIAHLATLPTGITVAINGSPLELANPDFLDHVVKALVDGNVPPQRLIIEVTEDGLLALSQRAKDRLSELVSAGVGLHVDDFGTGYSSLVTLRDYPVTGVKLDMSFTRYLGGDPSHSAVKIAKGLALLAESMGLDRIAEGVETEQQEQVAMELGWDRGQGWLYGKAEPPTELSPPTR